MFSLKYDAAGAKTPIKKAVNFIKTCTKALVGHNNTTIYILNDRYLPSPRNFNLYGNNLYEKIISRNQNTYLEYIKLYSQFIKNFQSIPLAETDNPSEPFWSNSFFPPLDAISLYGFIASKKPAIYMEIGSGNSTKFARRAISDHNLDTKIISIDPYPRAEIDALCDEALRMRAETLPAKKFAALNNGDIIFIDNSHRSFQNSDATFFFTEILPNLKPGVIYGIHDIFLPHDYPESWATRFYNEQYLLMAYLLGGAAGDEILFPVAYMSERDEVKKAFQGEDEYWPPWGEHKLHGGAFWMVKA